MRSISKKVTPLDPISVRIHRKALRLWREAFWPHRHFKNGGAIRRHLADESSPLPNPLLTRNGLRVHHGPSDPVLYIYNEIFVQRVYADAGFFRPTPEHTILDIGANIGLFALYCQTAARGIGVHCFEPAPSTRETLTKNVEANGLGEFICVYPYAVSDSRKSAQLNEAAFAGSRSLVDTDKSVAGESDTVECIPFGEALSRVDAGNIDLLKVDIEGSEMDLFEGTEPGDFSNIDRVVVEYHDNIRTGSADFVRDKLSRSGFRSITTQGDPVWPDLGVIRAAKLGPQ